MPHTIKRLTPSDHPILTLLALEDADFDLDGRSEPQQPLTEAAARRHLENPAVLHWVAMDADTVTGFLYCAVVPLRSKAGQELLLYEIGVRSAWRRRGVGRALLDHMKAWMRDNQVEEVWVLADNPDAVTFYAATGFEVAEEQPVYMTLALDPVD